MNGYEVICTSSQPEFRIFSFDVAVHKKAELTIESSTEWPKGVVIGMYDPKADCDTQFVSYHSRSHANFTVNNSIVESVDFFSIARGGVINIKFEASSNIELMLMRRNDIDYVIYDIFGSSSFDEHYVNTKNATHTFFLNFSKPESLFSCLNTSCDVTWTVPETTQYAVAFSNDSPLPIQINSLDIFTSSPSPITNSPVASCKDDGVFCKLHVPDNYTRESVSVVMYTDCNQTKNVDASVDFDISSLIVICLVFLYFFPLFLGLLFVCIGTGLLCAGCCTSGRGASGAGRVIQPASSGDEKKPLLV